MSADHAPFAGDDLANCKRTGTVSGNAMQDFRRSRAILHVEDGDEAQDFLRRRGS